MPPGPPPPRKYSVMKFVTILLSLLISLILTPILTTIASIIWLIRLLISIYLRLVYCGKVKLIDSMDSFQVFDKPNNLLESYTLLIIQGKADISKIRKTVSDRVINNSENLYEKLKCRVCKQFGFYCWENVGDDFAIENHVKLINSEDQSGNKNNNGAANSFSTRLLSKLREDKEILGNGTQIKSPGELWTEEKVLKAMGEMYTYGMPIDSPRWEILVVPNFTYKSDTIATNEHNTKSNTNNNSDSSHYALIFRTHHSLMDGISTYFLISQGISDYPAKTVIDPLKPLGIPFYLTLLNYLKLGVLWPKMMYENISVKPELNCFHGPELSSRKILSWTHHFSMGTVRKVRVASGSNTVSVLNAAVGGAFNKLGVEKGIQVPKEFTVVTSIPMLPYPNCKPQNRFSGAFFPLQVQPNEGLWSSNSELDRITSTHRTLRGIMESPLILMNSLLLRFIGILPGFLSQNMTDSRELTCLTSNVLGPVEPGFMFGGDKLVDIAGWVPIKNKTGFGICFISYCGFIRATVVADVAVASETDVEMLVAALENEIMEMSLNSGKGFLENQSV